MKTLLLSLTCVTGLVASAGAQVFQPQTARNILVGSIAGAIIGENNDKPLEGALIGAAAGALWSAATVPARHASAHEPPVPVYHASAHRERARTCEAAPPRVVVVSPPACQPPPRRVVTVVAPACEPPRRVVVVRPPVVVHRAPVCVVEPACPPPRRDVHRHHHHAQRREVVACPPAPCAPRSRTVYVKPGYAHGGCR